jgi:hypothetical protein
MTGKRLAAAAALCVLVAPGAFAQNTLSGAAAPATAGPTEPLAAAAVQSPNWPRRPEDQAATVPAEPVAWLPQEVEQAQARCAVLLKGLEVVAVAGPPLREGAECGTPVPMKLISVGRSPQIALSPPPTLTCDMVATLAGWLEHDVQPLARKHLGAPIARVETMSSYSCRNAYGRAHGRISEHGKADAIDIGSFVTAHGHAALIVSDWGPTARQIAAEVAAASKAAAAAGQAKAPAEPSPKPGEVTPVQGGLALGGQSVPVQRPATAAGMMPLDLKPSAPNGVAGITLDVSGRAFTPFGLMAPNRLGGPKPQATAEDPLVAPGGKTDFLRAAHHSACKVFNTVLGPEANNAHRNHFHLDMAERLKSAKICE